jgi:membrane-associated PAP2 superfamily phosphatase
MSKIFKLHIRLCKYSLLIEYLGKTYVIQLLKIGSDSSIPFRCQPAGHLAQSLPLFALRTVAFFNGRPFNLASGIHFRPLKKPPSSRWKAL